MEREVTQTAAKRNPIIKGRRFRSFINTPLVKSDALFGGIVTKREEIEKGGIA
jgi:hypothetical protein